MVDQDRVLNAVEVLQRVTTSLYIPHSPTPRQAAFLCAPEKERLFGGAAGGGKTDALLMAQLQWADYPEFNGVYFRRTYPELESSVIPRAMEWLAGKAHYNAQLRLWTFPSGGRLKFTHLETETDKLAHNSAEYTTVAFDELTQFSETQYKYLFSRLRRTVTGRVPPTMYAGSNPGGPGHDWVQQRWKIDLPDLCPRGRRFIPSLLKDNPHLNQEEYEQNLQELGDPVLIRQLLDGNWTARQVGGWFQSENFDIVDVAPANLRQVRWWDLAATETKAGEDPDWTAGVLMGKARDGFFYIIDVVRFRESPARTEKKIHHVALQDGIGVEIAMEQEPGASGKIAIDHYRRRVLTGMEFWGKRSTGDKALRARPLASAAAGGLIRIVRGDWNRDFITESEAFPQKGIHDDQIDAASGAFMRLGGNNALAYVKERVRQARQQGELVQ